ncbi:hypothetical protein MGU_08362 [Metarhizium guizhouense ARSEF 977]|uniref:Uncharacterized protein n=1 Tax=Metarhizium guizhouense (strain ARSEF 977) TaxID=1276136 RepID=A0A0B4GC03_METGA|nr:hypothetical protein MGU_08362 [Metarhizium guizhouense ARSEF 977]
MDPSTPGQPARGGVKIVVGAVQTSFKRELKAYGTYEMWTRVLSWDRKWLYLVTYFVVKGAENLPRPGSDGSGLAGSSTQVFPKKRDNIVLATSITKLVFKIGRLTVHPAVVLDASSLLPPRPGGWTSGGDDPETLLAKPAAQDAERTTDEETEALWDWRRTERERRRGLEHAQHLAALDDLLQTFSGEKEDVLGRFWLG